MFEAFYISVIVIDEPIQLVDILSQWLQIAFALSVALTALIHIHAHTQR